MRILITNDDGVYSPGIAALAQVASRFGEVRIVAPDVEMSSAIRSFTDARPVDCMREQLAGSVRYANRVRGTPGYGVVVGTPAWQDDDLVLYVVNLGASQVHAIWHAATVHGAKQ